MEPSSSLIDGAFWFTTGAILLLLVLSGFFSGSETALTASSRGKLRVQADKGSRGAQKALEMEDRRRQRNEELARQRQREEDAAERRRQQLCCAGGKD